MNKIIHLISGPRNISTALMYSFGNRPDMAIVDEPYYAYYLNTFPFIDHPGKEEILRTMDTDPTLIHQKLSNHPIEKQSLFIKNMAHHMEGLEWDICDDRFNLFLIRDPRQLIASFAEVIPQPTMQDIGLKLEWEILKFVKEKGYPYAVLDSNTILENPPAVLEKLCNKIGLPFMNEMLNWEKGPREEDGCWAKYWYKNVHQSTGFQKQKTSSRPFPERLQPLLDEAMPYYNNLIRFALNETKT